MSNTKIPEKTQKLLWLRSAGRCQYQGCNKVVYEDPVSKKLFSSAYIAHIVADSKDGPRGDEILSPQLAGDLSNLMILCDTHHRLVDREDISAIRNLDLQL